jgi:L-2-hydroxyglutarate oxidase
LTDDYEIVVVGGGIVGLAVAYEAQRRWPSRAMAVLEKEGAVAQHQSGRNSGVLHSGIYYRPGSLKARNCRQGKAAMERFCAEHGIPYETCGKVIVAVDAGDLPALHEIHRRGGENGVACDLIDRERLRELEPHAAGVQALYVPETGIVDFARVCRKLAERVEGGGGQVRTSTEVRAVRPDGDRIRLSTSRGPLRTRLLVNCAGLGSDRLALMSGATLDARIIPFRGEYYLLRPEAHHLCRNLIYPVPDPQFPFLGVHLTRTIDGGVECGPNAVFALAREGYRKWHLSPRDLVSSLTYPGFLKLAARYWRMGLGELHRSVSKRAFTRALQRLVPDIRRHHLGEQWAGIRAQAIARDGTMVDDFLIRQQGSMIHVGNAPSPAATSALNIAAAIADRMQDMLA